MSWQSLYWCHLLTTPLLSSQPPADLTMPKLLPSSLISMLFLPCFSTFLFILKPLLRIFHFQAPTALSQSLNFASFETYVTLCNKAASISEANISIFQYKQALGEKFLCIFCLSDVGEGEEVSKLNCSHLFHRSCLHKWFEHRRTYCPLCRCSLILFEAKTEQHEEVEDEEVEDSATSLLAFVQREWWGVVHPCG